MITKEAILDDMPRNPGDNNFIHESYVEQAMDDHAREMSIDYAVWLLKRKFGTQDYVASEEAKQLFNLYLKETERV